MKKYIQSSTISGNVGIWWITDKNDVIGIMKPVEEGYDTRNFVQYDNATNHVNYWKQAIEHLPDSYDKEEIYNLGYKGLERGRVIFDMRTQAFEITCSEAVYNDKEKCKKILEEFELQNKRYEFEVLNHYKKLPLTGNPAVDNQIYNTDF